MEASSERRIVLLGKTGAGKRSTANTIFGEKNMFQINHPPDSKASLYKAETRCVNGRNITLIDTPGFFDITMSEERLKSEMLRCIGECAPGPHAFLVVLKVERFTKHDYEVVTKINQYVSPEVFRFATVVFTHGDQLPEDITIQDFVKQSEDLRDLVNKCGGRCHVIDNKYWKNKQQNNYRSNQFQVAELLNTIDKMVEDNGGGYFRNEMLQAVEAEIQDEEKIVPRETPGRISEVVMIIVVLLGICISYWVWHKPSQGKGFNSTSGNPY